MAEPAFRVQSVPIGDFPGHNGWRSPALSSASAPVSISLFGVPREHEATILVFEHLGKLKPEKGAYSRRGNSKRAFPISGRIVQYAKYKAWVRRVGAHEIPANAGEVESNEPPGQRLTQRRKTMVDNSMSPKRRAIEGMYITALQVLCTWLDWDCRIRVPAR